MIDISHALAKLASGAEWGVADNDYNTLQWFSNDIPKPTRAEVEAKIEELKEAEPMRLLRVHRDKLLKETDWWAVSDRTMTSEQSAYRQALRDLPDNSSPILDNKSELGISGVTWPTKP
jgi:hypothetical protein